MLYEIPAASMQSPEPCSIVKPGNPGRPVGARAAICPHMLHVKGLPRTIRPDRHCCGYALANAGHDTRALQTWLGQASIMAVRA
jgi:hypothetical protein